VLRAGIVGLDGIDGIAAAATDSVTRLTVRVPAEPVAGYPAAVPAAGPVL